MPLLRPLVVVLALASSFACGDDEDDRDEPDTKPDSSVSTDCPASGEPAVEGCPCKRPKGEYCCGVGNGMICDDEKVWISFSDSPCDRRPDGDGGETEFDPPVPIIECRR